MPALNSPILYKMPCACQLPPELYPDSSEWGPPLWTVLHALAERSGRGPFPMYHEDERRSLISLFKALGKMIPCPSCKDHYDSYLREHPTEQILKELPYEEIHEFVKRWFWELHNWVNESYHKPLFAYEDLTAAYGRTNIRETLKNLDAPMTRAIRVRGANLLAYKEFLRIVQTLLSYYGV